MPDRDWKREVHENLAEEARREASLFWNPRLAKRYLEQGVSVAIIVVLTYAAISTTSLGASYRQPLLLLTLLGGMIAASFMLIGVVGLAFRRKDLDPRDHSGEQPPIGW